MSGVQLYIIIRKKQPFLFKEIVNIFFFVSKTGSTAILSVFLCQTIHSLLWHAFRNRLCVLLFKKQ